MGVVQRRRRTIYGITRPVRHSRDAVVVHVVGNTVPIVYSFVRLGLLGVIVFPFTTLAAVTYVN